MIPVRFLTFSEASAVIFLDNCEVPVIMTLEVFMINRRQAEEINKLLIKASDLEAKGRLKDAIRELEKGVQAKIADGNLLNRLGDLYIKADNKSAALDTFLSAAETFRKDTYYRNAIAICKKILRYDAGNVPTYLAIAELLVELDEKSDALIYFFSYVDKELEQNNKDEVQKVLDRVQKLGGLDGKAMKKVSESYRAIGREDLAQRFLDFALSEAATEEKIDIPEPASRPVIPRAADTGPRKPPERIVPEIELVEVMDPEASRSPPVQANNEQLTGVMKDMEAAIAQLRKAIRLDEVIIALDKSISALSHDQKQSIALLQKAMGNNLDTLQKTVGEFRSGSEKSINDLKPLINNLGHALANLNKNQTALSDLLSNNFSRLSDSFTAVTRNALTEIKGLLDGFQAASNEMCATMGESKECNLSVLKANEEMKVSLNKLNDSLTKYIIAQESKEKKQNRYIMIIVVIMVIMVGLFVVSIIVK